MAVAEEYGLDMLSRYGMTGCKPVKGWEEDKSKNQSHQTYDNS